MDKIKYNRKRVLESRSWSQYQQAIFEAAQSGQNHIMVNAVAGSGKTSSIEGIVASCPASWKIKVLAFNVHIVEELKSRLPSACTVTTVHKMGMTLLTRFFGGSVVRPNDRKYKDLCERAIDALIMPNVKFGDSDREKVVRKASIRLAENLVHYAQVTMAEETTESLGSMMEYYGIEVDEIGVPVDRIMEIMPRILKKGLEEASEKQDIGLDDLIWLPNKWDISAPPCDLLLVDEAQDANAAMIGIYRRVVGNGKIIILGDPYQAIYGFSGSDSQAWQKLKSEFAPVQLPLSVCYRCPRSHIRLAQKIVPEIEWADNAIEGTIEVIPIGKAMALAQPNDLLLCRFTAPLVSTCLELIKNSKKAKVRGRDIGKGLAALAKRISNGKLVKFDHDLTDFMAEQSVKLQDSENAWEALKDKAETLLSFWEATEAKTMEGFCQEIENLFEDDIGGIIILSTIHRAKGDQANRVFILKSDSLPFVDKAKHNWQIEQEVNLQYVALTRSKSALFFVPMPKKEGELGGLLDSKYGGMSFIAIDREKLEPEPKPQLVKQRTIPKDWHNPELADEFLVEYTPQIGDRVGKRGLYGWEGTIIDLKDGEALVDWEELSVRWESSDSLIDYDSKCYLPTFQECYEMREKVFALIDQVLERGKTIGNETQFKKWVDDQLIKRDRKGLMEAQEKVLRCM